MKKRFLLLLALTAALLLAFGMSTALATEGECQHQWGKCDFDENGHWYICEICGEKSYRMDHWVNCDAPDDVCVECGYQGYIGYVKHERDGEWHHNETEHWLVCPRCQKELNRSSHTSWCNESACSTCGTPLSGITAIVDHQFDGTWYSDETHHWLQCSYCGEIQEYDEHVSKCSDPGICIICGNPCEKVVHSFYGDYQYDDESHWQTCWDCGEVQKESHTLIVEDTYTYCSGCPYRKYIEHEHWARCYRPDVCAICYEPYSGDDIRHDPDAIEYSVNGNYHMWQCSDCGYTVFDEEHTLEYAYDDTYHWYVCTKCGEEHRKFEHYAYCDNPTVCAVCGIPYSGNTILHDSGDTGWHSDETAHWTVCVVCNEPGPREEHSFGSNGACSICGYKPTSTDTPTATPTVKPTEAPTIAPTEAPTEKPTEVPTEVPTEAPTAVPTDVPTEVPTEAPTAVPTEKPTEAPTKAPHKHVFRTYVFRSEGMHWSKCEVCGYGVTQRCVPESTTVNGVPCEVCGICGHTTVPEMTGISLPEEPMADASAVAAEGGAAPVLVYDLTSSLPEDSVFALCLQVVPQDGAAMPGDVQITVPCALDTANLRLVFIADGAQPVEVPFETADGMLTFTAAAPGVYALTPVQE